MTPATVVPANWIQYLVLSGWFVLIAVASGKRGDFQYILCEVAMKRGIVVCLACPVESVNNSGPSAILGNGDIVKGDVTAAADGISWEHGASPSIQTDLGTTLSSAETHINDRLW
jgi:hypothetical protein